MTFLGMPAWVREAECRNLPPEDLNLPFGDSEDEYEQFDSEDAEAFAEAYCARCPVLEQCSAYGSAMSATHGVWGGLKRANTD